MAERPWPALVRPDCANVVWIAAVLPFLAVGVVHQTVRFVTAG
ncbi:hypothetical protein [Saccharothrix hoggarensis]|uniref:Uncharacterized protein n=1 Tax=Saccharothrix hoggarensis TaxID=913853 RepID=A0ABW3R3C0_9PSEU